ncbi:MAG: TVP38/TMEM64 family protein [Clostridia bacterium]|nr:TVP38/TMEM64 family protein [Clostridia bacterium]
MEKKGNWKKPVIKIIISVIVLAGIIVGAYFLFKHFGIIDLTREKLQEYVASFGPVAPIIFMLASFLQVSFIPIPGAVTIIAGNYLFGFWPSFFYSYIAMILGSIVALLLGKVIGRPFVNWIAGDKELVDYYLKKMHGRENIILFFMFLLPFFPDDLLCSIAGIMPLGFAGFLFMQLITRATSILATLLLMSGEFIPYNGWGIPILITIGALGVVAFIISFKYSDKINEWFIGLFKIKKKSEKKSIEEDQCEELKESADTSKAQPSTRSGEETSQVEPPPG